MSGRNRPDPKSEALRRTSTLNPRAERVSDDLFHRSDFFDSRDLLQVKYEMVRRVRIEKSPVSDAAKAFGLSRPSFYKARSSFERNGLAGLLPGKRGPHEPHKLSPDVLLFIAEARAADCVISTTELAARVKAHFKIQVHPRSIERVLRRPVADPKEKKRR